MTGQPEAPALQTDSTPERCNRPHSEVRQRSQVVGVRMTDAERERFQAFADRKGMSLAELMRQGADLLALLDAMETSATEEVGR